MPIMIVAALVLAQAPPAAQPPKSDQPIDVTQKKKTKQVCKVMEVTGSRMSQRVCRDEMGKFDLVPNVTDAADNPGIVHGIPGTAKGGFGGVPQ